MRIREFIIKTGADAAVRVGAGATGPALAFSLVVAALKNATEYMSNGNPGGKSLANA